VGYRGRRAVFEVLAGTPEVRALLESSPKPAAIQEVAVAAGMHTLRDRCLDLVREGVTTFDEFARLRL
jgi:type IV pilus assembly protein PilB